MDFGFKSNMKDLEKAFDDLNTNFKPEVEKKVKQLAEQVRSDAVSLAPVDAGTLRQNIYARTVLNEEGVVGEVYTDVYYGAYVEFGTGLQGEQAGLQREGVDLTYKQGEWYVPVEKVEGTKKPTFNGKVTIVYGKDGQAYYKTNGQKPQPFLYPAMKQNEDSINEELKQTVSVAMGSNVKE